MASRRTKLSAIATAAVLGAGGWFLYSVMAVQGQGTLAQAPLNVQVQIPPAFIMALDDSGSMVWENLNNTRDGVFGWRDDSQSFYAGSAPRGYDAVSERFYYTSPPYGRGNDNGAIPPLDAFGFARSPDVNPGYFDPRIPYPAWQNSDGTDYMAINPASAPLDPRPAGSPGRIGGSLNLTANAEATADNWRFRVRQGMVIPVGTRLRGACNATNGNINTGGNYELITGSDRRATQACNMHFSYFPATFYLAEGSVLPATYGYSATPLDIVDPPGGRPGTLRKYEIKPGNFSTPAQYDAAIQNFSNWFSFYRVRREGLIGSALNSLVDVSSMRIGWFRINNRSDVTMRDMSDPVQKAALFNDVLAQMRASGSTPNRQAVRHLGEQFKRTGGANDPVQLSCQKNAGMLFTDGYINDGGSPNVGNLDAGLGAPFADGFASTMADIVTPYYYDSLVGAPLEKNAVPVPSSCSSVSIPLLPSERELDCQTNLHMNFYGIVLGTLGNQFGVNYLPAPGNGSKLTPDPYINPPTWQPRQDLDPNAVDEMWHATLNARGEMINATTPAAITAAMRRVLASVSSGSSPAGSIALTGSRIGDGSFTVSPFYEARNEGTDWYSRLTAQTVSVAPGSGVVTFPLAWEASAMFPSPAARNILVGRGNATPVPFTAGNVDFDDLCDNPRPGMSLCTGAQVAALGGGVTLDQVLNYIKGDQSLEVDRATPATAKFRFRTTPLGNIVNSSPVISGPRDDYGYRGLPAPYGASYATYLTTAKASRRPMVYAGANAGMLHGFDGRTTAGIGGVEAFGFIPQSVLGHTGNLVFPYRAVDDNDQKFKHRYFVDGPIAVSDAYYGSGWNTVLVGTTGAGARGAFALDVSAASAVGGTLSPSDRLWEVSDLNTALPLDVRNNIGHVLGKPVIVPVKTGTAAGPVTWRAIFGNGYNSVSGKAVLYLVEMGTGAPQITMIEATEASAPAGPNGLGNLVVADRWGPAGDNTLTARRSDGFADTVYAADQKGAVWKFDLRSASPANQVTPVFTTQLYTSGPEAGTRQPILGGLTAAAGPSGGVMLYFGTGSFSFNSDPVDSSQQSLYGVLDGSLGSPSVTITRASLLQQSIVTTSPGERTTTSNVVTPGLKGFYMDLPTGERFVGYPRVESGTVFMPTYSPNSASECTTQGVNWLYGLSALTGAAGLSNVRFDSPTGTSPSAGTGAVALDTSGTAPVKDVAVLAGPRISPLAAGATPADLAAALAAQCSMVIQVSGAPPLYMPRACGRQSWRQIR